jgi:hypothetical protein
VTRRFVIEHLPGVALVDQLAAVWAVVEMASLVGRLGAASLTGDWWVKIGQLVIFGLRIALDQANMLSVDSHQWPKANCHFVALDARDLAGQLHVLADDGLRSRIGNRMWEGVGRNGYADAIGCHPTAHNRCDGNLVAYLKAATPSHTKSLARPAG